MRKAVIAAGVSRLRPILMTSISTVAGMMPIALEFGSDGEVRSPMAIAVIGGFTTSYPFDFGSCTCTIYLCRWLFCVGWASF